MKKSYRAIGVMSGTSLDGLDVALCSFAKSRQWKFKILDAITISYPNDWKERLIAAPFLSGEALLQLHTEYGSYIGGCVNKFLENRKIKKIDLLASHGHTIFHQTAKRFTFQLGEGNAIHAAVQHPVVFDFRSLDVALNGQGAPLVPMGDRLLFSEYDFCINLGGIANVSNEQKGKRVAFDVCFANMALNYLAAKAGLELDFNGKMAEAGEVQISLLKALRSEYGKFYKDRPALGREGFETTIQPLLDDETISLSDRMRTFCESIVEQVEKVLPSTRKRQRVLITGGGAHHAFMLKLLRQRLEGRAVVEIPSREIVDFKEAMVFAFLGVLRVRGEVNVLRSVTRSNRDSCSGVLIGKLSDQR